MSRLAAYIIIFFSVLLIVYSHVKNNTDRQHITTSEKEFEEDEDGEEEGKTDEPSKFLLFHAGIRTPDDAVAPQYPAAYKWQELKRSQSLARMRKKSGRIKSNGVVEWKERGPANVPGRTRALLNIPGDATNNTWLAGAATGGIWRTTDGGMTWSERSIDFPALPISSFASTENGSVIYAGTGESVSSFYSAIGNGIFKSTDKGITWTQLPATNDHPDFAIITRLITHPTNANIIIATTVPHNLTLDNTSAIMRSADGGNSWTKVKELAGQLEQITYTPGNFNIQYVAHKGTGIWKSTDAGVTWTLLNDGMTIDGRIELSVSPTNPNILFASAEGSLSGTGSDLYYSSNAGATWSLVNVRFNNSTVDFLGGQGFYDNSILCDPFDPSKVYVGGVSLFKVSLTTGSTTVNSYRIVESATTQSFIKLQSFAGSPYDRERLNAYAEAGQTKVEIRFGPGMSQKAHRFLVPVNKTSGVNANEYTYQNYVDVPFEVWDVTNNKQLMVSFRDQNRDGEFNLVSEYLTNDGIDYLLNSREYIYVSNVAYSGSPSAQIATTGGHEYRLMYNFFPALAPGSTWDEASLPTSKLVIEYNGLLKLNATTTIVADGRNEFDNKNKSNQVDLTAGVHPDHHCIIPVIISQPEKRYKLLIGNDGGVFVSKVSTTPGTTEGDWSFRGFGLNTGQFYGADKKPGANEYIGGLQDNGTRLSPRNEDAHAQSNYTYGLGGDGFEVIWNSKDKDKLLSTQYYGYIGKSVNGGQSWVQVNARDENEYPFVTKLANAKDFPDRVFSVGSKGVYVSTNFGSTWTLKAIPSLFVIGTPTYLDVDVSRANANIVWAGSGMNNTTNPRSLYVSTNGGNTFTATANYTTVTLGNITKLATHPKEPNTAYALFSFAHKPKILRTKDLGATWEDLSGFEGGTTSTNGFPDVAVYCLYVRHDNPNIIWVGTEIGIVESQDNGLTWMLLEEFPNVAVWDMKGQDDQVVIATHGRGIWTATIANDPTSPTIPGSQHITNLPKIVAAGSSPDGAFVFRWRSETQFDSLQLYINDNYYRSYKNITQQSVDERLENEIPGIKDLKIISFKNGIPYQSTIYEAENYIIYEPKHSYATYFRSLNDLTVSGMQIALLNGSATTNDQSLQSNHKYSVNRTYEVFIRTPVIISDVLPYFYHKDIAIVEPGRDLISIEATLNGLDWVPLLTYDGGLTSAWSSAFSSGGIGTYDMYAEHKLDLSPSLAKDDTVLFRMRLVSDGLTTGWGWAIDYICIQELPNPDENVNASEVEVYPNPSTGLIYVQYIISTPSEVRIDIVDVTGRRVKSLNKGSMTAGIYTNQIDLDVSSGTFLVTVTHDDRKTTRKLIIKKE